MKYYLVLPITLALLGVITQVSGVSATESLASEAEREASSNVILRLNAVSQRPQACPEFSYPGNYAEIRTRDGDPLRVRATPNGRVIGAIPTGWQVIVYETDTSGNWTRVGSHFGAETDRYLNRSREGFASAEFFRAGWVATSFLVNLGFSCDKPVNLQSLIQPDLFGEREVTIHEDWVAMGDRLASLARSSN